MVYNIGITNSNERNYMVNPNFEFEDRGTKISNRLKELYPNAGYRLTHEILREHNMMLHEGGYEYADWYNALKWHRENIKRGSDFCPTASDIRNIIKESKPEEKQSKECDDTHLKDFAYLVKSRGWKGAILDFKHDPDTIEWVGTIDQDIPYSCFPEGYQQYLTIFHSGDIVGATEYYYNNATAKNKLALRKELDQSRIVGNDKLKTFYNVFADKTLTKGSIRSIVKQTKYETDSFKRNKANVATEAKKVGL